MPDEMTTKLIAMGSLQHVYDTFDKYLYLPDKRRLDLILAIALSKKEKGTPLWLIIVGASGDGKSEVLKTLEGYPDAIKIDSITPNTLASGKPDYHDKDGNLIQASDLGHELHDRSTLFIIPDLAVFSSKCSEDKNEIWAQFRNLYDGFINKRTGGGVEREYENCHITFLACSTTIIRDEIIVHQQLGTRELMWDTGLEDKSNDYDPKKYSKIRKAWDNEKYEETMRKELAKTTLEFLGAKVFKRIEDELIPDEMKEYLISEANRLAILRATVLIDQSQRECVSPVVPEEPTRLIKQFKRLYIALKSLDPEYSDDRIKSIIKTIVDSSGHKVRQIVIRVLEGSFNRWLKIKEISTETRIGRNSLKQQLEILWNMGIVDKETRDERIGGYPYYDGENRLIGERGGIIKEVEYYRFHTV
jgi:hypothetical protein